MVSVIGAGAWGSAGGVKAYQADDA